MKKTERQILEGYWRAENCPTEFTDAHGWTAVKIELRGLLPALETQTGEERLKDLKKNDTESLSEFI